MNDIVKRLRKHKTRLFHNALDDIAFDVDKAADEIERLRAELNQYRDAGIPATVYERNKELLRDIVKQQAENERLRAALREIERSAHAAKSHAIAKAALNQSEQE